MRIAEIMVESNCAFSNSEVWWEEWEATWLYFWSQVAIAAACASYSDGVWSGSVNSLRNHNLWCTTLEFFWSQVAIVALMEKNRALQERITLAGLDEMRLG